MSFLTGRTVLVTGAGGSIGSEICSNILLRGKADHVKKLLAFDNSELNLYNLQQALGGPDLVPVLGDVANETDVNSVFYQHRPDIVFHAAAYKHVALCQKNSAAAWRVNGYGTRYLCQVAKEYGVRKLLLISTDKAVRPTCVMGETKWWAENVTRWNGYSVIRLGNVYGSSGSVVPLWKKQMARGEPVTITNPKATRYFIMPADAAEAIVKASQIAMGGETFVPDMGRPWNILEMAKLLGAKDFKFVGLSPGEKLHEELFVGGRISTLHSGLYMDDLIDPRQQEMKAA